MDLSNAIRHVLGVKAPLQEGILSAASELGLVTTDQLSRVLDRPKRSVQTTVYRLVAEGKLGCVKSRDPKCGAVYGLPVMTARLLACVAHVEQPGLKFLSQHDQAAMALVDRAVELALAGGTVGTPERIRDKCWWVLEQFESLLSARADAKDGEVAAS